jgi:hypothetical protein
LVLLSLLCVLLMLLFLCSTSWCAFYCLVAAVVIFVVKYLLLAGIVTVVSVDVAFCVLLLSSLYFPLMLLFLALRPSLASIASISLSLRWLIRCNSTSSCCHCCCSDFH